MHMKKYIILFFVCAALLTAFYVNDCNARGEETTQQTADDSQQQDIDIPLPLQGVDEQLLYKRHYVVSYNKRHKISNWVAWQLTAAHLQGNAKRSGNAWHEDEDVPLPRATNNDYKRSGWTRGHMCPAGDCKWDGQAMYDTFVFSNCCPQDANLNSGTWNQIELSCRRWAERYGSVYIVCGPLLLRQKHETIGPHRVVVPEAFFKVVVCLEEGHEKGIAFVCRNKPGNGRKDQYVNTIRQVERLTGITFFPHLSADVTAAVKDTANLSDW